MKVYDLIFYIDMHVTEQEFSGYFDSLETLVKYFVKGIFSKYNHTFLEKMAVQDGIWQ